jgi:hypothetical protein
MAQQDEICFKSGFTPEQRRQLRAELDSFSNRAAEKYERPLEAIVQEIRYWQQSTSAGRTNPRKSEKQESFRFWNQQCMVCGDRIESLTQATFHHLKRGIPDLHSPENMRPLHRDEDKGCHEKLHGAPPGSLTAGSRRGRE